ncbi:hypothetical protein C8R48DRAFT_618306 [Suillus tomentosus]|nr:hypothetical protein C8R48DRAFT_618306 [Suillus tomentosus]
MMADFGMDVEVFTHTVPPGEEAFDLSHAGGEHEAFEDLAHQLADLTGYIVVSLQCINTQTAHWGLQIDRLVDAYLNYRSRDSGDGMPDISDQVLSGVDA